VDETSLTKTPLYDAHIGAGARMCPFAGYALPVQYPLGVLKEHLWTRQHAGLFDVSHMGQAWISGTDLLAAMEKLTPGDFGRLAQGRQKYSLLLNSDGGIIDDFMAARPDPDRLYVVVNGACKVNDFRHMAQHLGQGLSIERLEDRALLALQGPKAVEVLREHVPNVTDMVFMDSQMTMGFGTDLIISRSGYTGEDGFEISVPAGRAADVWAQLTSDERVQAIGLGARDSLRLEAGLPLYGHDLDETTSPVEADLVFAIARARRSLADFPGAKRILAELEGQPSRRRVGLNIQGAPAREGARILDADGLDVGVVTSGGFAPSLGHPIALGFVPPMLSIPGTALKVVVRDRPQPAQVVSTPFVPHHYVRKS
jgi:aminomethyltransferase